MRFGIQASINRFKSTIKDPYFWTWFLPFLTFIVFGAFILFAIFNYDRNYQLTHLLSSCRKLTDGEALVMLMTLFLSIGATLLTLGELFIFIENKKNHRKVSYLSLSIVSSIAVLETVQALLLANIWC